MTTTTVSPFFVSGVEEVELSDGKGGKKKYYKKEILPNGKRKYKGEELDFSKINPAVVNAFDDKAFDAVPFVLALTDNKHPQTGEEIKNLEGDLEMLEMSDEGRLFGFFDLSDDIVSTIKKSNGKLGVSTRIEVGYTAEDTGKEYDYALSHVCATTRPHIKGMSPWETVELSEDEKKSGESLDLSTEVIDDNETGTKETGDDLVTVQIDKSQLDRLLKLASDLEISEKGKDEDKSVQGETQTTQLSEEANRRIELAEQTASEATTRIELAERKAAQSEWKARRAELARAGVPPVMLTEAEKVLSLHKRSTITLTESDGNTTTVDATEVIENILDHAKGIVPLSEEKGHSVTDADDLSGNKEFEEFEKDLFANLDY